jgi:hypothetical protein
LHAALAARAAQKLANELIAIAYHDTDKGGHVLNGGSGPD